MEIGSIFEIDPSVLKESGDADALRLSQVDKYGKKNQCFTASGREAIELALISLEREKPGIAKCCLMPTYMCDSVFLPFQHRGWKLVFYHVDTELKTTGEELSRLVLEHNPGLLFVHPYFGTDTCRTFRNQMADLQKKDVLVMEDVTQSYYLEEAGKDADFVVGSLRKWYAIPDGGFVASDLPLAGEVRRSGDDYARQRIAPLVRKWEYLREMKKSTGSGAAADKLSMKEEYLRQNRAEEEALDDYRGVRCMSRISAAILSGTDEETAAKKRAENYRILYEKINGMKRIRPMSAGEKAAAPLYFPVYAKERDGLQQFLRERDIYAPVLWPIGEENNDWLKEGESYIFSHMLALPIDQRYGEAQMNRIADALAQYEKQPVIGIRADANDTIAAGHIMRCITIARQIKKRGCRVVFFTADEGAEELLSQAGMEQICLHTKWDRMEEELPKLKELLAQTGVKTLLVDSYQAAPAYFAGLKDKVRLACIDDCFDAVYPVDLLINYNAYHTRFPYEKTYGSRTKLLLGTAYVPLRETFRGARLADGEKEGKKLREKEGFDLLLASGGGDAQNALPGILQKLFHPGVEEFSHVTFHVVVGAYHPQGDAIEAFARLHENVKVYRPCLDMASLMAICDAAVSAAGTMLFELSAMQVPTVFFQSADNQRYDSEFFAAAGRMLFAGDIRQDRETCLEAVCGGVERLLVDDALRDGMRKKLSEVTDGRGAERIAEELIKL